MGIKEVLRRIWLFSANKIKSSESFSKQQTQLIIQLNSSLEHIIVSHVLSWLEQLKDNPWSCFVLKLGILIFGQFWSLQFQNKKKSRINLWVVTQVNLALRHIKATIASPLGGVISSWLGRKKIFIISAPILISGWIMIGLAPNKILLYTGRIITSFAAGLPVPSTVAYISEISHPR